MINIIEYAPQHFEAFRLLNWEWLEKYGLLESHDIEVLNDPQAMILDKGGAIYLAEEEGVIVGSAAIVPDHGDCFELVKMSVAPSWRGRGISKLLIQQCLDKAREIGVGRLILFSNSQLQTAIKLYSQYGFQHVPVEDSPFVTADVKMELVL